MTSKRIFEWTSMAAYKSEKKWKIIISLFLVSFACVFLNPTLYGQNTENLSDTDSFTQENSIKDTFVVMPDFSREYSATSDSLLATSRISNEVMNNKYKSIIKTRRPRIRENNGMTPWHCTYYAAHKATFLFPETKNPNIRQKIIRGSANQWISSAQSHGFKTTSTPSVWAVVVFKNGWANYFSDGHVAIVESINNEEKTMNVSDMNYAWLGVVTLRTVKMNDSMTEAISSNQNIIWFIPVQEIPEKYKNSLDNI